MVVRLDLTEGVLFNHILINMTTATVKSERSIVRVATSLAMGASARNFEMLFQQHFRRQSYGRPFRQID